MKPLSSSSSPTSTSTLPNPPKKPASKPRQLWPVFFAFLLFGSAGAQEATQYVKKAEDKLRGTSSHSTLSIHIVRPKWTRTMEVKSWALGADYALIQILSPARDKGTVFLKRKGEIWNYLPTIERSVKMPPSMMGQSWMGSDFNNDDLVRESSLVKDYTHHILKDTALQSLPCKKILLTPKPDAAVVWGKVVIYISTKEFMQLRAEQYDEDGFLVNVMEAFDPKEFGDRLLPSRMRITPVDKKGQYTELIYRELHFDTPLQEGFFSLQNMKNPR